MRKSQQQGEIAGEQEVALVHLGLFFRYVYARVGECWNRFDVGRDGASAIRQSVHWDL